MSYEVTARVLEGTCGLVVGAVWSCVMMWEGELHLRKGIAMWLVATLVAAAVAFLLWRFKVKIGAICLMVGCLVGPPALIGLLMWSSSVGAPL